MSNPTDSKYLQARASIQDMVNKVENINLSGGSILGGKPKAKKATKAKSRSASKSKKVSKSRSASRTKKAKSPTRAKPKTKKATKAKSRSASRTKKATKPTMMDSHRLADNLIQLGVQLKNQSVEGGRPQKRKGHKKSHVSSILLA